MLCRMNEFVKLCHSAHTVAMLIGTIARMTRACPCVVIDSSRVMVLGASGAMTIEGMLMLPKGQPGRDGSMSGGGSGDGVVKGAMVVM